MRPTDRVFSRYDVGMAPLEWLSLRRLRQSLVRELRGRIVEIGAGTGANLPHYDPSVDLIAIEANADYLRVAARRAHPPCTALLCADAQTLPLLSHSVDHVVSTLTLCTIADPARALAEARRVLRPEGTLVLLEHMQGEDRFWRGLTRALARPWCAISQSCRIDRRTVDTVLEAGFRLRSERRYLGGAVRMMVADVPAWGINPSGAGRCVPG